MKILLLSAYHSASHRYWCEGLISAFPEHDWTLKTQPARHFSWRVGASGLIWSLAEDVDFRRDYDLIVATSLSGVVEIKAMCPALQPVPVWVYFHENQFEHPQSDRQQQDHRIGWQLKSLQNALCADWISFNTDFNRRTFFAGARKLLKRFPEKLPGQPLQRLERRSDVLPVPLSDDYAVFRDQPKEADLIVWNHRWEWDKQPERFLETLVQLRGQGKRFRLAMLGIGGGRGIELDEYKAGLGEAVVHWGEVDAAGYREWLGRAGIGVSTAIHDFQGLSMLELAQAGAAVVVPNRQAYPECLPGALFYPGSEEDPQQDIADLGSVLGALLSVELKGGPAIGRLPLWSDLTAAYRDKLRFTASMNVRHPPPEPGR